MNRRTKIICTLGPATDPDGMLRDLIGAGMDVARINFSHRPAEEHAERIRKVREASQELDRPVAILADLPGPKIRVGEMAGPARLRHGERFTLTLREVPGDNEEVHLPAPEVFRCVKPGDALFLDDGLI